MHTGAPDGLPAGLAKCPTGIQGLDEITHGGLPRGRPSLVCGGPGCGKTLLGMEFLVRGALEQDEPGVFVSFEEWPEELIQNVGSLGWPIRELVDQNRIRFEHVRIERSEIVETGDYDLEGLFIRLEGAVRASGAKRIVLDTIESLFSMLSNEAILRSELRRLFRWIKDKGLTAVVTGEHGPGKLTRKGIEEYVSDCVLDLNVHLRGDIATRRVRVIKYRGSAHESNEFPFLIAKSGFSVMPITSVSLDYAVSEERLTTGISRLDTMLGGKGFYKGSSVLISGTAGSGKSSLAASFANAVCAGGGKCLFFAFEESVSQIIRNMRSIGIDLGQWIDAGLLQVVAGRPTALGLEMHLVTMFQQVQAFRPDAVVVDPVSNLSAVGNVEEVKSTLTRFIDHLKSMGTTALFTDLTLGEASTEYTECGFSSLIDTWILLRNVEGGGERNRSLYLLKSRGMPHSNQVREFLLTDHGVELQDVYLGPEGVLMGAARAAQEAREKIENAQRCEEAARRRRAFEGRRATLEAQAAALRQELAALDEEMEAATKESAALEQALSDDRREMSRLRRAD